jgi:hypothetical protein
MSYSIAKGGKRSKWKVVNTGLRMLFLPTKSLFGNRTAQEKGNWNKGFPEWMMKSNRCNQAVSEEVLVGRADLKTPQCARIDPSTGEMALRCSGLR